MPSGRRALPPILETATEEELLEILQCLLRRRTYRETRENLPSPSRSHPGDNEVIQFGPYKGITMGQQYELYRRGVALGADGDLLYDGDTVYVLASSYQGPCIKEIDYFHGISRLSQGAGPTAQMADDSDICSTHMINIDDGNKTIRNIIKVQRAFRSRLRRGTRKRWRRARWANQ